MLDLIVKMEHFEITVAGELAFNLRDACWHYSRALDLQLTGRGF